jgi:hypothetical protein
MMGSFKSELEGMLYFLAIAVICGLGVLYAIPS